MNLINFILQNRSLLGVLLIIFPVLIGPARTAYAKLLPILQNFKLPVWTLPKANPADVTPDLELQEMNAVKLIDNRFKRLKNKDGETAFVVVKREFFIDYRENNSGT